jgi:hypothetical protein
MKEENKRRTRDTENWELRLSKVILWGSIILPGAHSDL